MKNFIMLGLFSKEDEPECECECELHTIDKINKIDIAHY